MMLQPGYGSSGIVGVPVTLVQRLAWTTFSHEFGPACASSVTTTPESTPKFLEFVALDSTSSLCREIWWPYT